MASIRKMLSMSLFLVIALLLSSPALCDEKRTDGPEGSEFVKGEKVLEGYGWVLGIDVGTVILHADRHNAYDTGIAFGSHVEYLMSDYFTVNFALGYSHHNGNAVGGMHNLFFDIGPRARLLLDPFAPFISVSPGFVWQSFGNPVSDSAFSFAIDFGSGMDLLVSDHINMGLTYKYHLVFDRDTSAAGVGTADFMSLLLKIDFVF